MMGDETLAEVRTRLAAAMAGPDGPRVSAAGRSEVAEALERFLIGPPAVRGQPVNASGMGRGGSKKTRRTKPHA